MFGWSKSVSIAAVISGIILAVAVLLSARRRGLGALRAVMRAALYGAGAFTLVGLGGTLYFSATGKKALEKLKQALPVSLPGVNGGSSSFEKEAARGASPAPSAPPLGESLGAMQRPTVRAPSPAMAPPSF